MGGRTKAELHAELQRHRTMLNDYAKSFFVRKISLPPLNSVCRLISRGA